MINIEQQFGRLDVLINNAALGLGGAVTTFPLADWRRMMAVLRLNSYTTRGLLQC